MFKWIDTDNIDVRSTTHLKKNDLIYLENCIVSPRPCSQYINIVEPLICSLDVSSHKNNRELSQKIADVVKELNEIMRSKVSAIDGNCILGYKIDIINLREEYNNIYSQAIFIALQAIGDAVELMV